jgi:hypothetical protein
MPLTLRYEEMKRQAGKSQSLEARNEHGRLLSPYHAQNFIQLLQVSQTYHILELSTSDSHYENNAKRCSGNSFFV